MRKFLVWILRAYVGMAAYAVALAAVLGFALWGSGVLAPDRLRAALEAIRTGGPRPPNAPRPPSAEGLAERERILELRGRELQRLEDRVVGRLSLLKAEEEALEAKRREAQGAAAEAKRAQEDFLQTK